VSGDLSLPPGGCDGAGFLSSANHDVGNQLVGKAPLLRQVGSPVLAREVFKRRDQARAHGRVVIGERSELAVVPA
jgi:hypothetical protein